MIVIEHDGIVAPEYIFFLQPTFTYLLQTLTLKKFNLQNKDLNYCNLLSKYYKQIMEFDIFIAKQ